MKMLTSLLEAFNKEELQKISELELMISMDSIICIWQVWWELEWFRFGGYPLFSLDFWDTDGPKMTL